MMYLVHRETKEHRLYSGEYFEDHRSWKVVEADEEGWITWEGGECPLPASNQAEVMLRDGKQGSFDSIPLMTHRSWQKWNCGGDIIAYRPILDEKEEPGNHLCEDTTRKINEGIRRRLEAASEYVYGQARYTKPTIVELLFDRLKSAIAAAESIPAIIAEIDALLPEGYRVVKWGVDWAKGCKPEEQPAEDMSDWRDWQVGDVLEAVENFTFHLNRGQQYVLQEKRGAYVYVISSAQEYAAFLPEKFRFHSRPSKK